MATISSDYKLECVPDISMSTTLDIMVSINSNSN